MSLLSNLISLLDIYEQPTNMHSWIVADTYAQKHAKTFGKGKDSLR